MKLHQYSFSPEPELIETVDEIAKREFRSRSEMIVLLLRMAVKEKNRKRNVKKDHITGYATDTR